MERAFGVGSLIAALAQGAAAGTLATSLSSPDGLGWYSVLTALTVATGYLALGYAFTKWKGAGALRLQSGRRGITATFTALILVGVCLGSLEATAAPLNLDDPPRIAGFVGMLALAVLGVALAVRTLKPSSRRDALPLCGLALAAVATVLAVVAGRYPVIAPPALTVDATVSPSGTMRFLAIGIGLNVPLVLFYSWYAHYAFRGERTIGDH